MSAHLRRQALDDGSTGAIPFLYDLELLRTVLGDLPDAVRPRPDCAAPGMTRWSARYHRSPHPSEKSFSTDSLAAGLASDGALLAAGPARRDAPWSARVRAKAEPLGSSCGPGLEVSTQPRRTPEVVAVGPRRRLRAFERPEHPPALSRRRVASSSSPPQKAFFRVLRFARASISFFLTTRPRKETLGEGHKFPYETPGSSIFGVLEELTGRVRKKAIPGANFPRHTPKKI